VACRSRCCGTVDDWGDRLANTADNRTMQRRQVQASRLRRRRLASRRRVLDRSQHAVRGCLRLDDSPATTVQAVTEAPQELDLAHADSMPDPRECLRHCVLGLSCVAAEQVRQPRRGLRSPRRSAVSRKHFHVCISHERPIRFAPSSDWQACCLTCHFLMAGRSRTRLTR